METVPQQPEVKPPIRKTMPIVLVLLGAVLLIGISTVYNAITGSARKKEAANSTLQTRPSTADPQQVTVFEKQQAQIAKVMSNRHNSNKRSQPCKPRTKESRHPRLIHP